ncbi:hypothetical protein H0H92_006447 [Tricholoma furcatifolium]|nr:hypothetical protein H0H92_006447 [Tricholoma furcatifolium]
MFFRFSTAVALSVVALFCSKAAAVDSVCPVCPASIVYEDKTYLLTTIIYTASEDVIQCDYGDPIITGFIPYCLYYGSGPLWLTNTGGSCPSTCSSEIQTTSTCEYSTG